LGGRQWHHPVLPPPDERRGHVDARELLRRNLAQAELAQVAVGPPQPTWNAGPQENAAMRAKHALPVGDLA
jgi:hypothetical protein